MTTHKGEFYLFGGFRFDVDEFILTHKSLLIDIGFAAKRVLLLLLKKHGLPVSFDEIIMDLWRSDENVKRSQLFSAIHILRSALENCEPNSEYIITIKKGYIFVGPVSFVNSKEKTKKSASRKKTNSTTKQPITVIDDNFLASDVTLDYAEKSNILNSILSTHPQVAGKIIIKDPYRLKGTLLSDKYLLEAYLGGGGMGAVYLASQKNVGELVAIKILKPDVYARNPDYIQLFDLEVESARKLNHPNIVRIFDNGIDDDISYMVMELLEGRTLEDETNGGNTEIKFVANAFQQICRAFIVAHEQNIIHLDIKPANIFILSNPEQNNFVKVIDFGLAKILSSESGTTVTKFKGTDKFCSPEHFGGKLTKQSDIYSLGAVLYNMLTGVIPFGSSYVMAKMYPNRELPPIPSILRQRPDLPEELDKVIERALSKNPLHRQQSVRQLLDEFEQALSGIE